MEPIVIVRHTAADPPAGVGRSLERAGLPFRVCDVGRGDVLPAGPDEFSALIVLGGEMNTHERDMFPFLAAECELLASCLRDDAPVLGICLGAQQLAVAAGGSVFPRAMPEIGWVAVEAITRDPLLEGVASPFITLQWHDYSFDLPPGAVRVAARDDGEQAFRVGSRAWGVQFHPEVDAALVALWLAHSRERMERLRPGWPAEVEADTRTYLPDYPLFCDRVIDNFLRASGLTSGPPVA